MVRRLFLFGILVVGVLSGLVQNGTLAYLTAQSNSTLNQFQSGTIVLGAGVVTGDTLSVGSLVPGDSFVAGLTVENSGSLPLYYAMTTTVSGSSALASALLLTVRPKTANPCSSFDGAVIYGPGSIANAYFGSAAQGYQAGDRALPADGGSEDLCFQVQFPAESPPVLQGNDITIGFSFASQQQ